jgi:hypothetical protein
MQRHTSTARVSTAQQGSGWSATGLCCSFEPVGAVDYPSAALGVAAHIKPQHASPAANRTGDAWLRAIRAGMQVSFLRTITQPKRGVAECS